MVISYLIWDIVSSVIKKLIDHTSKLMYNKGERMKIYDYMTSGGKNLIRRYIDSLPLREQVDVYNIRDEIENNGLDAFEKLNTRQLRGKLWEIKISKTRVMYVIIDAQSVAFLHICKKQKGRAEKKEIETAVRRARNEHLI